MNRSRKTMAALVLGLLLAQALFSFALAATDAVVPIDHFDDGPVMIFTDTTGTGTGGSAVGNYFTGERDVSVVRFGPSGSASVTIDPANHYLEFLTGGGATGGQVILDYDGATDHTTINTAIDGVTTNLIQSPPNFGFHVEIIGNASAVTLRMEAYSTATSWSYAEMPLTGNQPNGTHVDYFLNFNGFTQGGATPANFASIDALKIVLTSNSANTALRLDFIEASTKRDFGDSPTSYGEVSHSAAGGSRLGANFDTETFQLYSDFASGDDSDQSDDEDGVVRPAGVNWVVGAAGGTVEATITSCPILCVFAGWVDWNRDGDFTDAGERIINVGVGPGSQTLTQTFPIANPVSGSYFARFRLFEQGPGAIPDPQPTFNGTGGGAGTYAFGGEVEDYYWEFGPTAIELVALQAQSGDSGSAVWVLAAALAVCLPLLGLALYLRRRAS